MSDDIFDQINDLFDDEEPVGPSLGDVPQVKVLLTGRPEQYVALGDGENTVAQVLDAAGRWCGPQTEVYRRRAAGLTRLFCPGRPSPMGPKGEGNPCRVAQRQSPAPRGSRWGLRPLKALSRCLIERKVEHGPEQQ
jgi:hypothetical protein